MKIEIMLTPKDLEMPEIRDLSGSEGGFQVFTSPTYPFGERLAEQMKANPPQKPHLYFRFSIQGKPWAGIEEELVADTEGFKMSMMGLPWCLSRSWVTAKWLAYKSNPICDPNNFNLPNFNLAGPIPQEWIAWREKEEEWRKNLLAHFGYPTKVLVWDSEIPPKEYLH